MGKKLRVIAMKFFLVGKKFIQVFISSVTHSEKKKSQGICYFNSCFQKPGPALSLSPNLGPSDAAPRPSPCPPPGSRPRG